MGSRYQIRDNSGLYFITITVLGWIDLFTRNEYRYCFLDSMEYCRKHKGLHIHAYVIMTSHVHAIVSSDHTHDLSGTIRDLKKFTSKRLIELIQEIPESRKVWMMNKFKYEANRTKRGQDHILWQQGYHGIQLETNHFIDQKLDYIHYNPVKAGFVDEPEHYLFSSARNYAGQEGIIEVNLIE